MIDSTTPTTKQAKASTRRQSKAEKAQQLDAIEYATGDIIGTAQGVSRNQRAAIAQKVGAACAIIAGDIRKGLLDRSRGMRRGCSALIAGRHGNPCPETGTRAKLWFETLSDLEAPIMALDKDETHDKAWRILHGMLPAFCDLMGRAWVEAQLDAKRARFDRVVARCHFDGIVVPPLLTRPVDIAHAHQIRLVELRAYGANKCGLTSIDPETPEQTRTRKRDSQEKWRRRNGMKPQSECRIRERDCELAALAKVTDRWIRQLRLKGKLGDFLASRGIDVPEATSSQKCGAGNNTTAPRKWELPTAPADALVIQPATPATARTGEEASQELSRRFRPRSIYVRCERLDLVMGSRSQPSSTTLAGAGRVRPETTVIDLTGIPLVILQLAA